MQKNSWLFYGLLLLSLRVGIESRWRLGIPQINLFIFSTTFLGAKQLFGGSLITAR
jgi:hypothetical protein